MLLSNPLHSILMSGYTYCDEHDPQAQFVEGYYYKPAMGKDSLSALLDSVALPVEEDDE